MKEIPGEARIDEDLEILPCLGQHVLGRGVGRLLLLMLLLLLLHSLMKLRGQELGGKHRRLLALLTILTVVHGRSPHRVGVATTENERGVNESNDGNVGSRCRRGRTTTTTTTLWASIGGRKAQRSGGVERGRRETNERMGGYERSR